jgi:subtilase family serine protease
MQPRRGRLAHAAALLLLALGAGAPAPLAAASLSSWTAHPHSHTAGFAGTVPVGYTPVQMRHAYGFDLAVNYSASPAPGYGQTIAVVEPYGSFSISKDLQTFDAGLGLPPASLSIVYPQGKPTLTTGDWALETTLLVEWAHALAPGAKILLVVARSSSASDLLGAVQYAVNTGARQVSMAWGGLEFPGEGSYDSHFNKPGVTFIAAAGDGGSGVEWPAASPYVVGVGGTTLSLDGSGNWLGESAWAYGDGGISSYEPEPSFQSAWHVQQGLPPARTVPDVAYNADPSTGVAIYDSTSYNSQIGWFQAGGTSAGAAQWTALVALANASSTPISSANPSLYALGSPASYLGYFHDITSGFNFDYLAAPGYDLVTGIGSPLANQLIAAM